MDILLSFIPRPGVHSIVCQSIGVLLLVSNPFNSPAAHANSCYLQFEPRTNQLYLADTSQLINDPYIIDTHHKVRSHIRSRSFPCVFGKGAINSGAYRMGIYEAMDDRRAIAGLCRDLWQFTKDFTQKFAGVGRFPTFIAVFDRANKSDKKKTKTWTETEFEFKFWQLLQVMHQFDYDLWPQGQPSDPDHVDFTFCFAGTPFLLNGLHESASRPARALNQFCAIVFNPKRHFDVLHLNNQLAAAEQAIRKLDNPGTNPNIVQYANESQAKQFSGRFVEADWQCPFIHRVAVAP